MCEQFCRKCGFESKFVSLDSATTLSGIRTLNILLLIENGEIHSVESENGHLLICKNSILSK
jgi:hypothetical protein